MDIILIQGSAVPCECVLSSAKETTTARQNQISGTNGGATDVEVFTWGED